MDTGQLDLPGEWYGWRLKGRHLVSPDGDRLTPERLRGLIYRDLQELRLAGFASRRKAEAGQRAAKYGPRIKVVIVDLADYRAHGLAAG